MLLGQFALGLGATFAASQNAKDHRIEICTSTGIQYIHSAQPGAVDADEHSNHSALGSCVFCTTSPAQVNFDLQDRWRAQPALNCTHGASGHHVTQKRASDFLARHPAPRAPPSQT